MSCRANLDRLARQQVGVLGFGREGRAAARALQSRNADARITVLVESGVPETGGLALVEGPFDERLQGFDALIRSPGVPVDHPALVAARRAGVPVINPISIWLDARGRDMTVVGVTGSKGKSTTASLLAHLLRGVGRGVLLAGNIGVSLLDHLETSADVAVIELSSYQLADLEGRLDIGLITRLFPEHLDWHGNLERYFSSKLRLAELLHGGPLLVNATDPVLVERTRHLAGRVLANRPPCVHRQDDDLVLDGRILCRRGELPLIGRHNLDNAALALQAGMLLGCEVDKLALALPSFCPLPHRLEPVASTSGVRFVNDSISTSPHATLAALEAIRPAPVVLIAGGQPRPADWTPVLDWVRAHGLTGLVTLPDNGRELAGLFRNRVGDRAGRIVQADDLDAAVEVAFRLAEPGMVVLLSPGAPSFQRFRDFEQRGERFRAAVGRIPAG